MFDWNLWSDWETWISQPAVLNFFLVLGIAVVSYMLLRMVMRFFITRSVDLLSRSKGRWGRYGAEVFRHTSRLLIAAMAVQIGLALVDLGSDWDNRVSHIWFLVLALQLGLWIDAAIVMWKTETIETRVDRENQLTVTIVSLLVWPLAFLAVNFAGPV